MNFADHTELRRKLAFERPMTSLIERDLLSASSDIRHERENWIEALVDRGHALSFDAGTTQVHRGLCVRTEKLFWLVHRNGKKHGYHSDQSDPLAAFEEADQAWTTRRAVRQKWVEVEELARDLLTGKMKMRVHIQDAHASPLCSMGINAFMTRMRIQGVQSISGRFAAMLMKVDPQVGFVIHQASVREGIAEEPPIESVLA